MAITALPTPPSTSSPSDFASKADAFLGALPTFVTEANALQANVNSNESTASTAATAATTQAGIATTQAGISTTQAGIASAAAASAAGWSATSSTSMAIGTGAKTLTIETSKQFVVGTDIRVSRTSDAANTYVYGKVTSYNSGSGALGFTVAAGDTAGSGTFTDWTVSLSGSKGATGAAGATFTGGSLTSALNVAKATVASAATTADIWGAAGNLIDFTGTATVTAFPAAPQAGAERRLLCAAACSFTNSANLIVQGAANYTAAAGDIITVTAITTTQFRLTIEKASGAAVAGGSGQIGDVIISAQAPTDTNYKEAGLVYTQSSYTSAYALIGRQMNSSSVSVNQYGVVSGQKKSCVPGGGYGFWMRNGNNYGYVVADGGSSATAIFDVGGTGTLVQIVGGTSSMALVVIQSGYGYGINPASPSSLAQTPAQVATFNADGGFYAFSKFWMFGYDTGTNNLKIVSNNATLTGSWTAATIASNAASTGGPGGFAVVTGASSAIILCATHGAYTSDSGANWTRVGNQGAGTNNTASNGATIYWSTSSRSFQLYPAALPLSGAVTYTYASEVLGGYTAYMHQYAMGHYWSLFTKTDGTGIIARINALNPMDQSFYPITLDDSTAWSSSPMLNAGGDRLFWTQSASAITEMKLANYTWATQFYVPNPGSPPPGFKAYVKLL